MNAGGRPPRAAEGRRTKKARPRRIAAAVACVALAALCAAGWAEGVRVTEKQPVGGEGRWAEGEEQAMKMTINGTPVPVTWADNASVEALRALCPLTIGMSMYGGFEQVGAIGRSLPRDDQQTTTAPGDIVLYAGNQLVVFYGSNAWAYTRLGHIDLSEAEMAGLLSGGDVTVALE